MERAIRVISVERGHDPRQFALLAFGGAGPLHGTGLAAKLGMRTVIMPDTAGVLSALGLLQTDLAHDYVQSIVVQTSKLDLTALNDIFQTLKERGEKEMLQNGADREMIAYQPSVDMRYLGQAFEINIECPSSQLEQEELKQLLDLFHERHRVVYGHAAVKEPVELVNLRLRVIGLMDKIEIQRDSGSKGKEPIPNRQVHFPDSGWAETNIFSRASLSAGTSIEGPAVVEGQESTAVIPPQWYARIDSSGNLIAELKESRT
jgi:N-methylhydantoinase A